jgi:hypothetical protein
MTLPWNMVLQMQFGQPIPSMGIGVVNLQSQLKILLCCLISNPKKIKKQHEDKSQTAFLIFFTTFDTQHFLRKRKGLL